MIYQCSRALLLSGLLLLGCIKGRCRQTAAESYYRADSIVNRLVNAMGGLPALERPLSFQVKGTEFVNGHFNVPEKLDTCALEGRISYYPAGAQLQQFNVIYRSKPYSSALYITRDSAYFLDYGSARPLAHSRKAYALTALYSPMEALRTLLRHKPTLHMGGGNARYSIIGFNDDEGNKLYLYCDNRSHTISKVERLLYDNIYGDDAEEIQYGEYAVQQGLLLPARITHKKDHFIFRELQCSNATLAVTPDTAAIRRLDTLYTAPATEAAITISSIGGRLFLARLNRYNNKVLVMEMAEALAVFDAPLGLEAGRQLIAALGARFRNKPVKYCFLSHHHPDHAGALPAFMEINARVITTAGNLPFFNSIAGARHTRINGKELQRGLPRPYSYFDTIAAAGSRTYFEGPHTVRVFEYGRYTTHTNEYLFFYFPDQQLLFTGDLAYFPPEGHYKLSARAYSIYRLIKEKRLSVKRICVGWPLKGAREVATFEDLVASVRHLL